MADYGFRISYSGADVETCSDLDCVLTSKYANFKGKPAVTGSISVAEGTKQTVTIAHGLSYIPFVRLSQDMGGYMDAGTFYDSPIFNGDGFGTFISAIARSDATNVYLDFEWYDYGSGVARTFNYVCFISIEKGKL